MNLIHGPMVTPPGDQTEAEANYPDNLGKKERINGQMVHHMDKLVGRLLAKLDSLDIADNTLVIFTGDNGTSKSLENRLGDFRLRGGKRTMNEAGTRVPFIARWPGKIPAGKRDAILSLMDVLPTLASVAGIPVEHEIDGMDLSHNLFDKPGKDREFFEMAFEGGCYFVRDKRFRLHEDGRFYDIPVTGDESRYSMAEISDLEENTEHQHRLKKRLTQFMAIKQTDTNYRVIPFGTGGDEFKNRQDRKKKDPRK
tara:strand:+ start:333 stop:1094 length:762 start_codon:yes stop_codon:yes gene_type:complete